MRLASWRGWPREIARVVRGPINKRQHRHPRLAGTLDWEVEDSAIPGLDVTQLRHDAARVVARSAARDHPRA
jgi:hypothetical protein